jgi:hypothetical protein
MSGANMERMDLGNFCHKTFSPFFSSQERMTQHKLVGGALTRTAISFGVSFRATFRGGRGGGGGQPAGLPSGYMMCSSRQQSSATGHDARSGDSYSPIFSTGIALNPSLNAGDSGRSR